jgi:hypothetical protein
MRPENIRILVLEALGEAWKGSGIEIRGMGACNVKNKLKGLI